VSKGKTPHPEWDDLLAFNMVGVDPALDFIKLELRVCFHFTKSLTWEIRNKGC